MINDIKYGQYSIDEKTVFTLNDHNRFVVYRNRYNSYVYEKYEDEELKESKLIASEDTLKMDILPITPINVPGKYASYMMLEFNPIILSPKSSFTCYLTMPVEIGVCVDNTIIDTYSLGYTKYVLYGNPERGIICRYNKSNIYEEIPHLTPLIDAAVRCTLINNTDQLKSISKIVYPIEGADMYYKDAYAYFDGVVATIETKFIVDIVSVEVKEVEWNANKTRLGKQFKSSYIMEWGF
ncbi:MAG: DUF432 domain-containing protein [Candidatus Nitrosocaldaceae archaeon]